MLDASTPVRAAAAALALALTAGPAAHAATAQVRVGNTIYTLSTEVGSFTDLESTLVDQPWWIDFFLASDLSEGLGDALGEPNATVNVTSPGVGTTPLFAYAARGLSVSARGLEPQDGDLVPTQGPLSKDTEATYAIATDVNVIPLPPAAFLLLGGLGALGLVKRRRA